MSIIKFALPVGAELPIGNGTIRYLGDGLFTTYYDDLPPGLRGTVQPGQAFGTSVEAAGQKFEVIPLEPFADPFEGAPVLAEANAPFALVRSGRAIVDSEEIDAVLAGKVH